MRWLRLILVFSLLRHAIPVEHALAQGNPVPPFSIIPTRLQGQEFSLSFLSSTGCVYSLQAADNLQRYWSDVTNQAGNGSSLAFTTPITPRPAFYRVAGIAVTQLTLLPAAPALGSDETSLPDAIAGSSYFAQVSPAGTGKGPYDLQFSGQLPDGVAATAISNHSFNAVLRLISTGTNLVAGQRQELTVSVVDSTGTNYSHLYNLRVISPPPVILSSQITLKSGAASSIALASTNGAPPLTWSVVCGALPDGISLSTAGVLNGTPTDAASEVNEDGLYTNVLKVADSLTDRVTGQPTPRSSCATNVTLVRLSYHLNLILNRPNGPDLGGICVGCHGPTFHPDFSSGSALSVIYVNAGTGGQCDGAYIYVIPGDPFDSLLYEKLTSPPCGEQMPQGGPYMNYIQTGRVQRWINELTGGDDD